MLDVSQRHFDIEGSVEVTAGTGGMPSVVLTHPAGARAIITLHGAHVTSWIPSDGEERLFLSRCSRFARGRAIRGGIPVVFPQFGPGALPQHGFARTRKWELLATQRHGNGDAGAVLGLKPSPSTRAMWPHRFRLYLVAVLHERALTLALRVTNTGDTEFEFTAALHTYFAITDIRQAAVLGLQGVTYIDSLRNDVREVETREAIRFEGETDRVYVQAPDRVLLVDEASQRTTTVEKSGMADVVVWNPWEAKAQRMPDFGDDEWQRMVCVETGCMAEPVRIAPGEAWMGRTVLRA